MILEFGFLGLGIANLILARRHKEDSSEERRKQRRAGFICIGISLALLIHRISVYYE